MKASKVFNLSNMIDYQENSIVSRLLIDKNSGSVTLFAFDKGQALSEHTSPFDAMTNIVEGKAEISISGENQFASESGGGSKLSTGLSQRKTNFALQTFKLTIQLPLNS